MFKENYPSKLLEEAVDAISSLPGVGRRSALRLALHLLKQPAENVHHFTRAVDSLRDGVKYCAECNMIADAERCAICSDHSRDRNTICVVESVRDVMSIENTGQFHGVYHVLGGIISPINGVGPSDLGIDSLVERLEALCSSSAHPELDYDLSVVSSRRLGNPSKLDCTRLKVGLGSVEVIFALSGDVEGETTAFYIYRRIARFNLKVSSLARGLGFGDDLEYADELTLGRSIVNRQEFRP